jgi:hypothetical protein
MRDATRTIWAERPKLLITEVLLCRSSGECKPPSGNCRNLAAKSLITGYLDMNGDCEQHKGGLCQPHRPPGVSEMSRPVANPSVGRSAHSLCSKPRSVSVAHLRRTGLERRLQSGLRLVSSTLSPIRFGLPKLAALSDTALCRCTALCPTLTERSIGITAAPVRMLCRIRISCGKGRKSSGFRFAMVGRCSSSSRAKRLVATFSSRGNALLPR